MEHKDNLIWVVGAKPMDNYYLELQFNDGRKGKFDCKPLIKSYALFKDLENPEVFFNIRNKTPIFSMICKSDFVFPIRSFIKINFKTFFKINSHFFDLLYFFILSFDTNNISYLFYNVKKNFLYLLHFLKWFILSCFLFHFSK